MIIWRLPQKIRINIDAILMIPHNVTVAKNPDDFNLIQTFLEFKACIPTLIPR
jgi:hypothetical protein